MATWLVVEDEPDLAEMFEAATQLIGVNSLIFSSGEAAKCWIDDVECGRFKGETPELALLDIRLSGEMTGVMVSALLRECARLKTMTLVLMTAYRLSPAWEKIMLDQSGANLLLYKPLPGFFELRRILQSLVHQ
jgi:DNA-binding response OmpR family regulator